jgi:hypothetical protein
VSTRRRAIDNTLVTHLKTVGRPNLTVLLGAQPTKVVLESADGGELQAGTAVEFAANMMSSFTVKANKEVILSAVSCMP